MFSVFLVLVTAFAVKYAYSLFHFDRWVVKSWSGPDQDLMEKFCLLTT